VEYFEPTLDTVVGVWQKRGREQEGFTSVRKSSSSTTVPPGSRLESCGYEPYVMEDLGCESEGNELIHLVVALYFPSIPVST